MREIMMAAALATMTAGSALAADLPIRSAPPPFVPPLPVFTWTGAYFGINGGYAFDSRSRFETTNGSLGANGVSVTRPALFNVDSDGFTAGGQVGYNYQIGAGSGLVLGVEADAAYTDLGQTGRITVTSASGTNSRITSFHSDLDFLGTFRARAGFAFDRFLVYGTGGFAYGDVSTESDFLSATGRTLDYAGSQSGIDIGYTYGGGVEYALPVTSFLNVIHSSAVTIKAEYLHYDLGSRTYFANATGLGGTNETGAYIERVRTDGDLARVGLNFKF